MRSSSFSLRIFILSGSFLSLSAATEPLRTPEAERLLERFIDVFHLAQDEDPDNDRVLSGQAGLHGKTSTDAFLREAAGSAAGQLPTIFALSYDYTFDHATGRIGLPVDRVDGLAARHLEAGGVVMLSARFRHPAYPGKGHRFQKGNRVMPGNLRREAAASPAKEVFWNQVDLLADALCAPGYSERPVLLRLFWEMDIPGAVFWWGGRDPEAFVQLWREVVDYLRVEKQVRNVLFVFSPAGSNRDTGIPEAQYYPGDEYVDLVALTAYSDHFADRSNEKTSEVWRCYEEMRRVAPRKPIGFAEVGPKTPGLSYDWSDFLEGLEKNFPEAGFFTAHNNGWALTEVPDSILIDGHSPNRMVSRLLNSPRIMNLPEWRLVP